MRSISSAGSTMATASGGSSAINDSSSVVAYLWKWKRVSHGQSSRATSRASRSVAHTNRTLRIGKSVKIARACRQLAEQRRQVGEPPREHVHDGAFALDLA